MSNEEHLENRLSEMDSMCQILVKIILESDITLSDIQNTLNTFDISADQRDMVLNYIQNQL